MRNIKYIANKAQPMLVTNDEESFHLTSDGLIRIQ